MSRRRFSLVSRCLLFKVALAAAVVAAVMNPTPEKSMARTALLAAQGFHGHRKRVTVVQAPSSILGRSFINLRPQSPRSLPVYSYAQLLYSPRNLAPMVQGANTSEGVFQPLGQNLGPGYAMFSTTVQPAPGSPMDSVVWINQQQVRLSLIAGTTQPGGSWPVVGQVPSSKLSVLLAAFEGGFQFNVAGGGWYQDGRIGIPLVQGAATIAQYTNGTLDIGAYGPEITLGPNVVTLRQNLTPLVDGGQITASAQANPLTTWGYSLGNLVNTWRSGLGIDAMGNLIWVGGPGLSPLQLAQVLIWAGAQRGMELDINPDWVNFATYAPGGVGTNLESAMVFPPSHYLTPFWRDFVAVYRRSP